MSGRVVCRGWVEPRHPLLVVRRDPAIRTGDSDTVCKDCRLGLTAAVKAAERVRLAVRLRAPVRALVGTYSRHAAAIRLRFVRRVCRADYMGYLIEKS